MFSEWYEQGMKEGFEDTHCHCGGELFYPQTEVERNAYLQFDNMEMCKRCIDVRCDAFPGACKEGGFTVHQLNRGSYEVRDSDDMMVSMWSNGELANEHAEKLNKLYPN